MPEKSEERPEYGMDCYVCGTSVALDPNGDHAMPAGWGFVQSWGMHPDGRPGMVAHYACPSCKDGDS